jgi:hypothetical protein
LQFFIKHTFIKMSLMIFTTPSRFFHAVFAALALCVLLSAPAHAKRGGGIINTGDELFTVGDFPADIVKDNPAAKTAKVGYKCSHFGLFWADVWTWDCKLVAVTGTNSYADLPAGITANLATNPSYAFSKAERGLWNKYAFWTLVLGGLALLAFVKFSGKGKQADAA